MRVITNTAILLAMILITASPALADWRDRDNDIEDTLHEWIEYAEDLGYDVIETRIDYISDDRTIYMELGPGEYHAYAEGGRGVGDLDMTVYGDWGYELGSDFLADNYPIVDFRIDDWQEVVFELSDYEHDGWSDGGEFCFVLAQEWGHGDRWDDRDDRWRDRDRWDDDRWDDNRGRDNRGNRGNRGRWNRDDDNRRDGWDRDWDYDDWDRDWDRERDRWHDDWHEWSRDWNNGWRGRDGWGRDEWSGRDGRDTAEARLDELYDFAWDRGLYPIMDDVSDIRGTRTYELDLPRGTYVVMAAGGPHTEDLDLHVYWRDQWEVAEDVEVDASPAVWFHLPNRTTVEIEVEVWAYANRHDEDYFCILICED